MCQRHGPRQSPLRPPICQTHLFVLCNSTLKPLPAHGFGKRAPANFPYLWRGVEDDQKEGTETPSSDEAGFWQRGTYHESLAGDQEMIIQCVQKPYLPSHNSRAGGLASDRHSTTASVHLYRPLRRWKHGDFSTLANPVSITHHTIPHTFPDAA